MQNIVFLPASDAVRTELFQRGMEFYSCHINNKHHLMIVTNQLRLVKELARENNISEFYISDNRRQLFKLISFDVDFVGNSKGFGYLPIKYGKLKRTEDKSNSFLVVTENNATYHYSCM